MEQRIGVDQFWIKVTFGLPGINPHPLLRFRFDDSLPVGLEGFGAVSPPSIYAVGEQTLVGLPPVTGAGLWIEGIVGGLIAQ